MACSFSRFCRIVAALSALLAVTACKKKPSEPRRAAPRPPIAQAVPVDASVPVTATLDAAAEGLPDDLIDVAGLGLPIDFDIRYATADNFAGRAVYPAARCLLRRAVAKRLAEAARSLEASGYRLRLWDCYRPFSVQEAFWKLVPDERYVAKPVRAGGLPSSGSKHNRGAAIDVTITLAGGTAIELPTDYDDFSARAHRDNAGWSEAAAANVARLTETLTRAGFATIATEWWHFDGPGWRDYGLADLPL